MTSRRKSASGKKVGTDDLPNRHIRFDYSDTYLDNEELALDLEDHAFQLRKEHLRKTVENEEDIKKAKKDADEMLQLKEALKKRDPNESSKRVSKSADLNRRTVINDELKTTGKTALDGGYQKTSENQDGTLPEGGDLVDGVTYGRHESNPRKQINNLTMFLLSLQKLKGCGLRQKREQQQEVVDEKKEVKVEQSVNNKPQWPTDPTTGSRNRPNSYSHMTLHGGNQRKRRESDPAPRRPSSQYGIHVKRDFTRSRRELEEISRIEQDAKYGYVNKYEERRKRLLSSCKNTGHLEQRIGIFLKDVDDFKNVTSNVNTLDKVLSRAKSAQMTRAQTALW